MIKCVFFDFDGVLRSWDREVNRLEEDHGIPRGAMWEIAFAPENVIAAVRGEVTDAEWRADVARQLSEKFPDGDITGAMHTWNSSTGVLVPEVLAIVLACKSKLSVGLMTNATTKLNQDLESLGIADLFDHVVNASEVGSVKPEPEIYLHALKLAGVEPHEAFFADDRPENIDAAERLGYVGHLFKTPEGLRTALTKAGVL